MKEGTAEPQPERDLKKPQLAEGTIRRSQMAAVELTTDVAGAVSAGWKAFRDQLSQSNTVLDASVLRGSVEAAATFLEGLAKAARASYDRFQYTAPGAQPVQVAEIDYDKLAKALAPHLKSVVKP